jgi:hypothetical protein
VKTKKYYMKVQRIDGASIFQFEKTGFLMLPLTGDTGTSFSTFLHASLVIKQTVTSVGNKHSADNILQCHTQLTLNPLKK